MARKHNDDNPLEMKYVPDLRMLPKVVNPGPRATPMRKVKALIRYYETLIQVTQNPEGSAPAWVEHVTLSWRNRMTHKDFRDDTFQNAVNFSNAGFVWVLQQSLHRKLSINRHRLTVLESEQMERRRRRKK